MASRGGVGPMALVALSTVLAARAASAQDVVTEAARKELAATHRVLRPLEQAAPANLRGGERRLHHNNEGQHASAHLRYYQGDADTYTAWYSTLVPKHSSEDTYFSVLAHNFGYMGLQQVEERGLFFQGQAIFSIWDNSCHHLLDPDACPESERAEVVECGEMAICQRFGHEGTGFKSIITFSEWELEQPYGFLVQAFNEGNGKMRFEGYFHAYELGGWVLVSKIRVNLGHRTPRLDGLYSFVEQWSDRSSEDVRWGRYGPMFLEAAAVPNSWSQVMEATFTHVIGSTGANGYPADSTHIHANVTNGGTQWGLGIGGNLVKGVNFGDTLSLSAGMGQPADLQQFQALRSGGQLPGGCMGGTCLSTQIAHFFSSGLTKSKLLPFLGIALAVCMFGVSCCCGGRLQRLASCRKAAGPQDARTARSMPYSARPQAPGVAVQV